MSHTGNSIDGKQILRKYDKNTVKGLCRTTQDHGHPFDVHVIEKVHSDKEGLSIPNYFKRMCILLIIMYLYWEMMPTHM